MKIRTNATIIGYNEVYINGNRTYFPICDIVINDKIFRVQSKTYTSCVYAPGTTVIIEYEETNMRYFLIIEENHDNSHNHIGLIIFLLLTIILIITCSILGYSIRLPILMPITRHLIGGLS